MVGDASPQVLDVAIVGGGISGIYSGWRLLNGGQSLQSRGASDAKPQSVVLFEASPPSEADSSRSSRPSSSRPWSRLAECDTSSPTNG